LSSTARRWGVICLRERGDRNLVYKFRPATTQNYQLSLSGPVGLPQTYFILSGQRYTYDDYLYGTQTFLPTDTSITNTRSPPRPRGAAKRFPWARCSSGPPRQGDEPFDTGGGDYVPGDVQHYRRAPDHNGSGLDGYFQWRLNPDGRAVPHTRSIVQALDVTHTVSASTFYTVSVQQNYFDYYSWAYDDFYDPGTTLPVRRSRSPTISTTARSFRGWTSAGTASGRTRSSEGALTSQVTRDHQIKIGAELQDTKMEFGTRGRSCISGTADAEPHREPAPGVSGVQTYYPISGAAYASDMIEWNDLTIRAGSG